MQDQWEELEEFPDYAVSNQGDIVNMKTGAPRKTSLNQYGIVKISLYRGRELCTRALAVLVAECFVQGKTSLNNTPIHLDGDRTNCRADNLMWRPRWFAVQYHRQWIDPVFHRASIHFVDIDTGREYYSIKEACQAHGLYHHDVYASITQEIPTPMTGQEFRMVDPPPEF